MKTSVRSLGVVCLASVLVGAAHLRADDVTDTIKEGLKAYEDKDFVAAAQAFETATQLVKQRRSEGLKSFFPAPPKGWDAEEASAEAGAAGMFGGGITAERQYTKGDASITLKFITDSPLMQGMMMMMGNPMFASADGGKLVRIKGQRAVLKYKADDMAGSISIAFAGTLLVQIDGSDCTEADLMLIANAIDFTGLAGAL